MKPIVSLLMIVLVASTLMVPLVQAATPHELAKDAAILAGIAYLNTLQAPDGSLGEDWEVGITSLYLIACLEAGIPKADANVQAALAYILSKVNPSGYIANTGERSYETSTAIMALAAYDDPAYSSIINAAADYVLTCQYTDGSFGYYPGDSGDLSNSQYAVLGLIAAEQTGWSPPSMQVYDDLATWVASEQNPDGGYGCYQTASSGAGTSSALICLALCGVPIGDPAVQGGLTWLHDNWDYTDNPGYDWLDASYYYYYGVTKALAFYGITNEVGGVMDPTTAANPGLPEDQGWYFDLCEHLIVTQLPSGDWPPDPGGAYYHHTVEIIFAVLVLERAIIVPPQPPVVGGSILSVNPLQSLAPYLLALVLAVVGASGFLYKKRVRYAISR